MKPHKLIQVAASSSPHKPIRYETNQEDSDYTSSASNPPKEIQANHAPTTILSPPQLY